MRRLAALAAAAALVAGVAGCSAPRSTRPMLWSGFVTSVIFSCLDVLTATPGAFGPDTVEIGEPSGRLGWRVKVGELQIDREAGESVSWSVPSGSVATAARVVPLFLRCVDRYRIDWSLARADSPLLRVQLYRYYSEELMHCLAPWGVESSLLPSRVDFAAARERFDPYQYIHAAPSEALVIERVCPPAPLSVLAAVSGRSA